MTQALDPTTLDGLRELDAGGETGFVAELVGLFVSTAAERRAALDEAFASGDSVRVSREAHSLKSSAGNIGALALSKLCQSLEYLGAAGRLDEARAVYARVSPELDRALTDLRGLPEFRASKGA
jgi:HPt (histidine-containing phosphotransfer) domain-containing protein